MNLHPCQQLVILCHQYHLWGVQTRYDSIYMYRPSKLPLTNLQICTWIGFVSGRAKGRGKFVRTANVQTGFRGKQKLRLRTISEQWRRWKRRKSGTLSLYGREEKAQEIMQLIPPALPWQDTRMTPPWLTESEVTKDCSLRSIDMSQVNKAFEANEGGWSNGSEKVRGLSAVRQHGFMDGWT